MKKLTDKQIREYVTKIVEYLDDDAFPYLQEIMSISDEDISTYFEQKDN